MSPDHVNRDVVRERVAGLFETYGRDGVCVTTAREEPDTSFEALRGYAVDDDYLGGAYAFVVRSPEQQPGFSETMPEDASTDGDRVLLALGRTHETWGPAGGGRETGESFPAAAEREVREEIGVACTVTGVAAATRGVGVHEPSDREVHFLYVVFDAIYDDGTLTVQSGELNGACWFREPPANPHWLVADHVDDWFETDDDGADEGGADGREDESEGDLRADAGGGEDV